MDCKKTIRLANGGWKFTDEVYHRRWLARIMKKITVSSNGCWLWHGVTHPKGYGQTNYRGRTTNLHRAMWIVTHNVKLTTEQYVLHKCDVRNCCNPAHLWIGTAKDNNNDCARKGRHCNGVKTHCKRGHEYSPENTGYKTLPSGSIARVCKLCSRIKCRLEAGWSLEDALRLDRVPHGYTREHVR